MESTSRAAQRTGGSEGLSQLKRQFDEWRAERKAGERIPLRLWAGAVSAAGELGTCRVAAELHLDYGVLKRRAAMAVGKTPASELAPRFVELSALAVSATPAASHAQCVVEMDNARGAKMRVELNDHGLAGLSALCSAFWAA